MKHLPPSVDSEKAMQLFAHYGATNTRPLHGGKVWLLSFRSHRDAARGRTSLHGLEIMGHALHASFKGKKGEKAQNDKTADDGWELVQTPVIQVTPLPGTPIPPPEPMAPSLGLMDPAEPSLTYRYPPADDTILCNILNALKNVPLFYEQTLHIMNRMHLPPPFGPSASPPLTIDYAAIANSAETPPKHSSTPDTPTDSDCDGAGSKRKRGGEEPSSAPVLKRIRGEAAARPAHAAHRIVLSQDETVTPAAVADENDAHSSLEGGKNLSVEEVAGQQPPVRLLPYEELSKDRLSLEDVLRLPKFSNYSRGEPTNRLYVKNLHRKVSEGVLRGVFARYLLSAEQDRLAEEVPSETARMLTVDLKTKGRLKGQAFVEFPQEDQAERALQGAFGLVLEGKPMVIVRGVAAGIHSILTKLAAICQEQPFRVSSPSVPLGRPQRALLRLALPSTSAWKRRRWPARARGSSKGKRCEPSNTVTSNGCTLCSFASCTSAPSGTGPRSPSMPSSGWSAIHLSAATTEVRSCEEQEI